MRRPSFICFGLPAVLLLVAACAGGTPTAAPTVAPVTGAPPTAAPASDAPSAAPSAGAGATIEAAEVGDAGTILVAGSNGMTLYVFTKDVKDSGASNCNEGCIETWPPLRVEGGGAPTAGPGVTGSLGTITREDGTAQVTYNGVPLYFFVTDEAPGDLEGVYEFWETVAP